jgi:hypothetical protein
MPKMTLIRSDSSACFDRLREVWYFGMAATTGVLIMSGPTLAAGGDTKLDRPNFGMNIGMSESAAPKNCERVDFTTAEIVGAGNRVLLRVGGLAPHPGMSIEIRPALYFMQPDFWQMALVACLPSGAKPAGDPVPFAAEINLAGCLGRKGIEVTGKSGSKSKRLEFGT